MPRPKRSFSPEFWREAAKLVIDESRPIVDVARELGIGEGTLGSWVARYRRDHAGGEYGWTFPDQGITNGGTSRPPRLLAGVRN